jgi:hypothetical protein
MALSNAERQARWRERQRQRTVTLQSGPPPEDMPAKGSDRAAWDEWLLRSPQVRVLVDMAQAAYLAAVERAVGKVMPSELPMMRGLSRPADSVVLDWIAEKGDEEGMIAAGRIMLRGRREHKARKHGKALRRRLLMDVHPSL